MFKHYLHTALRNIRKNGFFSSLNILGFALGIAIAIFLVQYITYEFTYDKFIRDDVTLFRINTLTFNQDQLVSTSARTHLGLAPAMKSEMPEVESYVRIWKNLDATRGVPFRAGDKIFYELGVYYVDSTFLELFSVPMVYGDASSALKVKDAIVLSRSMAKKLFGAIDPIGKNVDELAGQTINRTVTGVFEDIPNNSHLKFDILIPIFSDPNYSIFEGFPWYSTAWYTYVKFRSVDNKKIRSQLASIVRRNNEAIVKDSNQRVEFELKPVREIYLDSNLQDELKDNGSRSQLMLLISIASLLLIVCAINYSNVSMAFALGRAKEIGVRKALGAVKSTLKLQFLTDALLINGFAVIIAIVLFVVFRTWFEELAGISTPINSLNFIVTAVCVWLLSSLLSGVYPAFILSSFQTTAALKGSHQNVGRKFSVRKVLIIFQFIISIVLTIWSLNFFLQVKFFQDADIGFSPEKVLVIHNPTVYAGIDDENRERDFQSFKHELTTDSRIKFVTTSSAIPGAEIGFTYVDMLKTEITSKYDPTPFKLLYVGYDYIEALGLKLAAGRNFSDKYSEDRNSQTVILNDEAIRALGFNSPDKAIGKYVNFQQIDDWEKLKIEGVVANYHHKGLKEAKQPIIFYLNQDKGQMVYFSVKLNSRNYAEITEFIRSKWNTIYPTKPFNYFFLDDRYKEQYKDDNNLLSVISLSALLVVAISSLGLINLSLFDGRKRAKEVGIRRVVGAPSRSIVALLLSDFLRMAFIANAIALPMGYSVVNKWLAGYQVGIDFQWWTLALAFAASLLVVIFSTLYSAISAAKVNPVKILKSE